MVKQFLAGAFSAAVLAGCTTGKFSEVAPRGGWRAEAERACMDRRAGNQQSATAQSSDQSANAEKGTSPLVNPSVVELMPIIEDPCGIDEPLRVSALVDGQTAFDPVMTLGCPLTEALDSWLRESVQPAAIEWIGAPVIEIKQLSHYACRKRNTFGSGYSEHAFGNALDISAFRFANEQQLIIAKDWDGSPQAQGFFREIFATACQRFTTVMGPGSTMLHYNHIHVDLAIIAPDKSPKMCKPSPEVTPPARTPITSQTIAEPGGGTLSTSTLVELPNPAAPAPVSTATPGAD